MDFSSRVAPLKRGYAGLFTSIPEAFVQGRASAPNYEVNTDDYDSEVATIIRRLSSARSAEEVETVLKGLLRWLGDIGVSTDNLAPVAAGCPGVSAAPWDTDGNVGKSADARAPVRATGPLILGNIWQKIVYSPSFLLARPCIHYRYQSKVFEWVMHVLWMFFHITNNHLNRLSERNIFWNLNTIQEAFWVFSKQNTETKYHSSTEIRKIVELSVYVVFTIW
jgi:hypothetical protein